MNRYHLSFAAVLILSLIDSQAIASEFTWDACTLDAFTNKVQVESCAHHQIDNGDEQIHMFMLDRTVVSFGTDRKGQITGLAMVVDYGDEKLNKWRCENLIRQTVAFMFPDWDNSAAVDLYTDTLPSLISCADGSEIKTAFGNRLITITPSKDEGVQPVITVSPK